MKRRRAAKESANGRWRPTGERYEWRECRAEKERLRGQVICDDRMRKGKQRASEKQREGGSRRDVQRDG